MEGFIFSGVFWGVVVMLIGVGIIVQTLFKIDLHIPQILLALFFIYIGIRIITGGFKNPEHIDKNNVIFGEATLKYDGKNTDREYNVVFGKGTVNLTDLSQTNGNKIRVNVIFGEGIVEVDSSVPMVIHANSAFGDCSTPDGRNTSFGDHYYQSPSYKKDKNFVDVEASVVFGAMRIVDVSKRKK